MTPDAERWLRSADTDLGAAHVLINAGFHSHAVFHSHLYLEKLLKALISDIRDADPVPFSHNLTYLSSHAGTRSDEATLSFFAMLSPHSVDARLPR